MFSETVSGRVVNQYGTAVPDATVSIYGETGPTVDTARQNLTELSDPIPDAWNQQTSGGFALTGQAGLFQQASADYVALSTAAVSNGGFIDSADLTPPKWRSLPAGEPITVTVWDPSKGDGLVENEYDSQLPGATVTGQAIFEKISPSGAVTQTVSTRLKARAGEGGIAGAADFSDLEYGTVTLTPGTWRVHAQGSDVSYLIQVGSPSQRLNQYRQTVKQKLTQTAQEVTQRLNAGMVHKTTTTAANGTFSVEVPQSVQVVQVQARKAPVAARDTDGSLTNVSRAYQNGTAEQSLAISTQPVRAEPPASNVTVPVAEISYPPAANASRLQDLREQWLDAFANKTMARVSDILQQQLDSISRDRLKAMYNNYAELAERNQKLLRQTRDLLKKRTGQKTVDVTVNASDATDAQLRDRLAALEQSLNNLRSTLKIQRGSTSTTSNTVSTSWILQHPVDTEQMSVLAQYANGTTVPVDDQYVTVESSTLGLGQTTVRVTDYPLGSTDPASMRFRLDVATSDAVGSATSKPVVNPTLSGQMAKLRSVSLSSLSPGTNENVTVSVTPQPKTPYKKVQSVTVYAPDGTTIPTTRLGPNRVAFVTSKTAGVHRIAVTYSDTNGHQYQVPITVPVGKERDRPAGVRVTTSPVGTFAVVGDGLESGAVDIAKGGAKATVEARTTSGEVPSSVHVYIADATLAPDTSVTVRVTKGTDGRSLDQRVATTLHLPRMDPETHVYRNGEPLPQGNSAKGIVAFEGNQTRIETITGDSGTVTVRTNASPGLLAQVRYELAALDMPDPPTLPLAIRVPTSPLRP